MSRKRIAKVANVDRELLGFIIDFAGPRSTWVLPREIGEDMALSAEDRRLADVIDVAADGELIAVSVKVGGRRRLYPYYVRYGQFRKLESKKHLDADKLVRAGSCPGDVN